ncbi:helix-turn-helix domain-containing protein [Gordonia pseudamarae]|uniref:helix-turn-helix domain-containing protein n=1 Tax=Gordonia pseudamarae TaxID=2831662 RepID=UPI003898FEE9
MTHRNAFLTERGRLSLARCVVEDHWPLRRAAERFNCSPATAKKWADRYRERGAGVHVRCVQSPTPFAPPAGAAPGTTNHQGALPASLGSSTHCCVADTASLGGPKAANARSSSARGMPTCITPSDHIDHRT